jgi:hypothetical protein
MQAYKTEATVEEDGSLIIRSLPFPRGERVEVIVLPASPHPSSQDRYPLRGMPYEYHAPTEPVAEDDWEAAG